MHAITTLRPEQVEAIMSGWPVVGPDDDDLELTPPAAPLPVLHRVAACWVGPADGEFGQCGIECECGLTYDGFVTLAEANLLMDRHIIGSRQPASVPEPAAGGGQGEGQVDDPLPLPDLPWAAEPAMVGYLGSLLEHRHECWEDPAAKLERLVAYWRELAARGGVR